MGFWDEDRWTRPYGYRPGPDEDNPYTLGYHIGQDIAGADWFGLVPALRGGVVVDSGRGSAIGGYVVLQVGDVFDTYCHLNSANLPPDGTTVEPGDGIAPLARSLSPSAGTNYTGSASTGPHLHFVVSTSPATAYSPRSGSPVDPRPIIRSIITGSAAGSGAVPFPEEDDMPTANEVAREVMNYQVPKYDSTGKQVGMTTLAAVLGWDDTNNQSVIAATIAGVFSRPTLRKGLPAGDPRNGQPTTLDATIAYQDANFANVKLDPAAITASILAGLPGQIGNVDAEMLRQIVTESVEKAQAEALQKLAQGIAQAAS